MTKKIIALAMALLISVLLCACSTNNSALKTVTFNEKFVKVIQMTPEQLAEDLKGHGEENYESITVNNDGTVSVTVTEEQRKYWVDSQKAILEKMADDFTKAGENYKLIFDDNFTSIGFHFSADANVKLITSYVMNSEVHCAMYQLFKQDKGDDWKVSVAVYNSKNGKLVTSGDSDAGLAWRAEDWKN